MEKNSIVELIKVLYNNKKNNILLMGIDGGIFTDAVLIPSTLPSSKLSIGIDDKGQLVYPNWLKEVISKENDESLMVVIDEIDKINTDEQNKFYGLIKYKGINGFDFPKQTQIVVTSKSLDKTKISEKLMSLMLMYTKK